MLPPKEDLEIWDVIYDYYNLSRARENAKVFALDLLTLEHVRTGF